MGTYNRRLALLLVFIALTLGLLSFASGRSTLCSIGLVIVTFDSCCLGIILSMYDSDSVLFGCRSISALVVYRRLVVAG